MGEKKIFTVYYKEKCLADRVAAADTFFARFRGLMLRRSLRDGEGLLLTDCPRIHCMFMRFPIDAVYLDRSFTVTGKETVRPWRTGRYFRNTVHVLELKENGAEGITAGDRITAEERRS